MVSPNTSKMEYHYLGNTGLRVLVLSFGTWVNNADDKLVEDCVKVSLEHGANFFDTVEIYGLRQAELALGKVFKNLKVKTQMMLSKEENILLKELIIHLMYLLSIQQETKINLNYLCLGIFCI